MIISFTATIMLFELCERKNNVIVYMNTIGELIKEETEWVLVESPETLTISELKNISKKIIKLEKDAIVKENVVNEQILQVADKIEKIGKEGIISNVLESDAKLEVDIYEDDQV